MSTPATGARGQFIAEEAALRKALSSTPRPPRPSALSAALTFGWRGMLKVKHVPEQLLDVTITPVMFVLMFTYLFGGAIAGSTGEYLDYILPGILVMGVLFTTVYSGIALNTDLTKGVVDRFRTLPIWRPAPMVGYLLGDLFRYVIASVVMLTVGLIMGFRPDGGVTGVLAGVALLVVFSFAFSWIWTMFGLLMRTEKAVMGISMMVIFPVTFLSNIFVDPKTMPGWLQALVNNNPITHLSAAVRGLMAGQWPATEIAWTLGWGGAIVAIFGTLTMRLYNRK
jgi:daunorubicin/doxorubicin transport system permease protein